MPLKSLGLQSDLMVLGNGTHMEDHGDRIILRTPQEPDFWFGNTLIFKTPTIAPDRQIAQFQADFPQAGHVTLQWDTPNALTPEMLDGFKAQGFTIDATEIMVLEGALIGSAVPEGVSIRPLVSDADWEQAIVLQGDTGVLEGRDEKTFRPFIRTRMQVCREQTDQGCAAWFGAFDGDLLVGDLGIYASENAARFQAVETRLSHRRKGICAALLTAGTAWALERFPQARVMIVAHPDSAAGRIYRRAGFDLRERLMAVYRGPQG